METIKFEKWLLKVDLHKTRDFFMKDVEICRCIYCENYMEACKQFDTTLMDAFSTLGINPFKPSHLSEFGAGADGLRLYIGSYHLVGNLVDGVYCSDSNWNAGNTVKVENFTFGFSKELQFVHKELEHPVLQLDFEALIPWILNQGPEE
nr:hypothetical protein [Paenibacillus bovis]